MPSRLLRRTLAEIQPSFSPLLGTNCFQPLQEPWPCANPVRNCDNQCNDQQAVAVIWYAFRPSVTSPELSGVSGRSLMGGGLWCYASADALRPCNDLLAEATPATPTELMEASWCQYFADMGEPEHMPSLTVTERAGLSYALGSR